MKALDVRLNGKRKCIVGFPRFGVVSAIITGVRRTHDTAPSGCDDRAWRFDIGVGGLHSPEAGLHEHVKWLDQPLRRGDKVTIEIVEARHSDEPIKSHRNTQCDTIAAKRAYLKRLKGEVKSLTKELAGAGRDSICLVNAVVVQRKRPR